MSDSDDSDFYGPPSTTAVLRHRASSFDPASWWKLRRARHAYDKCLSAITGPTESGELQCPPSSVSSALHNPYAGVPYAWQLNEPAEAFVARLRPSITTESHCLPCIYACNPWVEKLNPAAESLCDAHTSTVKVPSAENEAPLSDFRCVALLPHLVDGGMERLHLASRFIDGCRLRSRGRDPNFVVRECRKAGADAARDVLGLAREMKLTGGKWMLFCGLDRVDDTWATIVRATINNELGIAAKVTPGPPPLAGFKASADAPRPGGDADANRLICIYTADFGDMDDVLRVAERLEKLGLLRAAGRPLYYKPGRLPWFELAEPCPVISESDKLTL